jgi:hypothetical protein
VLSAIEIVSSVGLLGPYANWSGSRVTLVFLGTGSMVACLKHVGITDSVRNRLKMSVKTLDSCSAHARSTSPGNLSGPAAL